MPSRRACSPSSSRTTLPGEPMTMELSGISLPSVIRLPAPIRQLRPMRAPLRMMELYADQAAVADRASVQHHHVADGNVCANGEWRPVIGMQNRVVLHVAILAHFDGIIVAAQYGAEPYACVLLQDDIANHDGIGRYPVFVVSPATVGYDATQVVNIHPSTSFIATFVLLNGFERRLPSSLAGRFERLTLASRSPPGGETSVAYGWSAVLWTAPSKVEDRAALALAVSYSPLLPFTP